MHYMNDYYELALAVCGMDPDDDKNFESEAQEKVDEILMEKFDINEEQFVDVAKALLPFAHISKSEITEEIFIGYGNHEKGMWIFKQNYQKE